DQNPAQHARESLSVERATPLLERQLLSVARNPPQLERESLSVERQPAQLERETVPLERQSLQPEPLPQSLNQPHITAPSNTVISKLPIYNVFSAFTSKNLYVINITIDMSPT